MILSIENLHVYYGNVHAVKGIDIFINKGETVALLGANGAGKTTIIKAINGLIKNKKGKIVYKGESIEESKSNKIVQSGIATVPEGREIFMKLTVSENLKMGAFTEKNKKEINNRLKEIFELFPRLYERKNQIAGTFSGGEQQMLAIARGLMSDPELLLLDEPSLGLAPLIIESVYDVCRELKKKGTTILLVEQNANQALSISDRAYILETGKIKLSGDTQELLNNEEVKNAYLGG